MMPDREKVKKGLECCTRYEVGKQLNNCLDCPYVEQIGFNQFRCKSQEMKEDALFLLKEQEPKRAIRGEAEDLPGIAFWVCPSCRIGIDYLDRFCRHCGQELKWE